MKYKDLIKKFEPYAEEEVDMVVGVGDVVFFPLSDEDCEIVHLVENDENPYNPKGVIEVEG